MPPLIKRAFMLAATSILTLHLFAAPPGNDDCSGATLITPVTSCGGTQFNLQNATSSGITSTCNATTNDVWFYFTVPSGITDISISLSSLGANLTTSNTYIELYDAINCTQVTAGNSHVCATAASGINASGLSSNTVYYLRVFTSVAPTGNPASKWNFTLCVSYTPPPSNDECGTATALTIGTINNAGSVWLATASGISPAGCATGTPDDDVWYSFTATATNLTINLSSIGADLNTSGSRLQLFSGSCVSLGSLACGTTSISASSLSISSTYFIRVYSAGAGSIGTDPSASIFSILVSVSPGNDECAGAYLLPTTTSTLYSEGTVVGATTSAGVPIGACTGTPDDDVWFKFTATKSSPTISLTNIGSNLSGSSRMQLLSGTLCGSLISVACGTTSIAASSLTVGANYYVRVYSSGSSGITSNGNFYINVTDPTPNIVVDSTTTLFNMDTVCKQLGYPWEITYGPDDSLWITEARGYRVLRISATRTQTQKNSTPQQVLKIPLGGTEVTFSRSIGTWPQGGMQGLAIHPDFMTNPAKRWVYIAYVFSGTCPSGPSAPCIFRTKIIRGQFYFANDAGNPTSIPHRDTLVILDTVISNLPGSNDHNSGRLKIGPVTENGTYKLYYTIGDMGAGQFNNTTRTNYALTKDTCEGKVLRLNTEPDLDPTYGITHDFNTWRQWIPNDNPFTHSIFTSLPTPIYSYGHRNAQGLAWGQVNGTWRLYSSEHGDHSDDEVNVIENGKNYGWPKVAGVADDNYTTYDDASDGYTFNNVLANQNVTSETAWVAGQPAYKNPIFDFFNWNPAQIEPSNTGNLYNWPTIAPSSIDFYNGAIPGWKNSLLVTTLKYGMFRLKLNSTGDAIDSTASSNQVDTFPILHGWRVRDVAINPGATSGTFWVVIDSSGATSGPTGGFSGGNSNTKDGGKVLKLTYKTLLTLAVDFISFTGKLQPDRTILLNWRADVDQAHAYFDVEKQINSSWVTIGRVSTVPPYRFVDLAPLVGDNIYRIKEVEHSGKVDYSKIINVVYNLSPFMVSLYPNPVTEILNLKLSALKSDNVNIQVSDVQGRVVYKKALQAASGMNDIQINAKNWSPGLYTLKITGSNNQVITVEKFIRQ